MHILLYIILLPLREIYRPLPPLLLTITNITTFISSLLYIISINIIVRYALKKKTILFGNFSQTADPPPLPFCEPRIQKQNFR